MQIPSNVFVFQFFNLTSKHACPTKSNITGDIPSNITNPSYCPKPWLNETTTTTSTTEITSSSSTSTTMTTTTTQPPFFPFSFLTGLNLALVIITGYVKNSYYLVYTCGHIMPAARYHKFSDLGIVSISVLSTGFKLR